MRPTACGASGGWGSACSDGRVAPGTSEAGGGGRCGRGAAGAGRRPLGRGRQRLFRPLAGQPADPAHLQRRPPCGRRLLGPGPRGGSALHQHRLLARPRPADLLAVRAGAGRRRVVLRAGRAAPAPGRRRGHLRLDRIGREQVGCARLARRQGAAAGREPEGGPPGGCSARRPTGIGRREAAGTPLQYGDALRLVAAGSMPRPGNGVEVITRWEALAPWSRELPPKLSAKLVDATGYAWAQADDLLAVAHQGWQPGQQFVQVTHLVLPGDMPPGDYGAVVALYDDKDGPAGRHGGRQAAGRAPRRRNRDRPGGCAEGAAPVPAAGLRPAAERWRARAGRRLGSACRAAGGHAERAAGVMGGP